MSQESKETKTLYQEMLSLIEWDKSEAILEKIGSIGSKPTMQSSNQKIMLIHQLQAVQRRTLFDNLGGALISTGLAAAGFFGIPMLNLHGILPSLALYGLTGVCGLGSYVMGFGVVTRAVGLGFSQLRLLSAKHYHRRAFGVEPAPQKRVEPDYGEAPAKAKTSLAEKPQQQQKECPVPANHHMSQPKTGAYASISSHEKNAAQPAAVEEKPMINPKRGVGFHVGAAQPRLNE